MILVLWLGVALGALMAGLFGLATIGLIMSGEMVSAVMSLIFTAGGAFGAKKCFSAARNRAVPSTGDRDALASVVDAGPAPAPSSSPKTALEPPSPMLPPAADVTEVPVQAAKDPITASESPSPTVRGQTMSAQSTTPPVLAAPPSAAGVASVAPSETKARSKRTPAWLRMSGVRRVHVTRRESGRPAIDETYVALDLETTGLDAARDTAVEVGAVRFTGAGEVLDEFATLVAGSPSSQDARNVHMIEESDRVGAPSAKEVWAELFDFLGGSVLVAHNLEFEKGFIEAAAKRHRLRIPDLPAMCTLVEARRHFDGKAFSLKALHRHAAGIWRDDTHQALGDARATMDVWLWMIRTSPAALKVTGLPPQSGGPSEVERCVIRCRPAPLREASIAAVIQALPQSAKPRVGDPEQIAAYLALLEEVLDDGRVTYEEAEALAEQAMRTGLTGPQLAETHRSMFDEVFPDLEDSSLGAARLKQIAVTAKALGLLGVAEKVLQRLQIAASPEAEATPRFLRGRRYAFAGESAELASLRRRALDNGAPEVKNVTKTVLWCAADDPEGMSRHHVKARELGIPLLPVDAAAANLEEDIAIAEQKQFEREQALAASEAERARYEAERAKRQAESDAYWRPTWRRQEHKEDPGPAVIW